MQPRKRTVGCRVPPDARDGDASVTDAIADAGKVFAATVFEFEDDRVTYPERRYSTIGMLEDRMVVVIWVDAEDGRRVISMRKANARERTRFERYLA